MGERTVWMVEFLTPGLAGQDWFNREEDAAKAFAGEARNPETGAVRLVRITLDEERLGITGMPLIPEDREDNPIQYAVEDVRDNMSWKDTSTYAAYGIRALEIDREVGDESVLPWNLG